MLKGKRFFIGRHSTLAAVGRIHTYAVYDAFGIPRERWLTTLTRQVVANDDERAAIARYLSSC